MNSKWPLTLAQPSGLVSTLANDRQIASVQNAWRSAGRIRSVEALNCIVGTVDMVAQPDPPGKDRVEGWQPHSRRGRRPALASDPIDTARSDHDTPPASAGQTGRSSRASARSPERGG